MSKSIERLKVEIEKLSPKPGDLILIKLSNINENNHFDNGEIEDWANLIKDFNIDAEFLIYVAGSVKKIKTVRTPAEAIEELVNDE